MGVLPDWMIAGGGIVKPCEPGVKRPGSISYGVSSYGYDARIGYKFKVFTPVHCGEVDPKNFDPKAFVEVDLSIEHEFVNDVCKHCFGTMFESSDVATSGTCPALRGKPKFIRIPPNSFALGETIEEFDVPRDCIAIVLGKSTYARCGIIVNVTPLEPEWRGKVTVEISNTTPLPAKIYAGEGIMQVLFLRSDGHRSVLADQVQKLMGWYASMTQTVFNYNVREACTGNSPAPMTCRTSYADKGGKYQDQRGVEHPKVD